MILNITEGTLNATKRTSEDPKEISNITKKGLSIPLNGF